MCSPRTCGHEDETILPQQSCIDGLQLVGPETVQSKLLVKYIHHFCRVGKFHTPETLQGRVMNHWIWETENVIRVNYDTKL